MFPNRVKNLLHFSAGENIKKVEFYTSNGILVMTSTEANNPIDMENIPAGMYFVKIYTANNVSEMKVIKSYFATYKIESFTLNSKSQNT